MQCYHVGITPTKIVSTISLIALSLKFSLLSQSEKSKYQSVGPSETWNLCMSVSQTLTDGYSKNEIRQTNRGRRLEESSEYLKSATVKKKISPGDLTIARTYSLAWGRMHKTICGTLANSCCRNWTYGTLAQIMQCTELSPLRFAILKVP